LPPTPTSSLSGPAGFFGPGGEIIATPEYAIAYEKQYRMPYDGTVGFRDNTGKLILGMTANGMFTQTGYYDTSGTFHSGGPGPLGPMPTPLGAGEQAALDKTKQFATSRLSSIPKAQAAIDGLNRGTGVGLGLANIYHDFVGPLPFAEKLTKLGTDVYGTLCNIPDSLQRVLPGSASACRSNRVKPRGGLEENVPGSKGARYLNENSDNLFGGLDPFAQQAGNIMGAGVRAGLFGLG
jgi:hypothetical protein